MIPGNDSSLFVDLYLLVLIIAVAVDRVIHSLRYRPFWLGFVISGTGYVMLAIVFWSETNVFFLNHVHPLFFSALSQPVPTSTELTNASSYMVLVSTALGCSISLTGGLISAAVYHACRAVRIGSGRKV
jgi:hypothetical protein